MTKNINYIYLISIFILFISIGCNSSSEIDDTNTLLVERLNEANTVEEKSLYLKSLQENNFDFEQAIVDLTLYINTLNGEDEERILILENVIYLINQGDMQELAKELQSIFETIELEDKHSIEEALSKDEIVEVVQPQSTPTPTPTPDVEEEEEEQEDEEEEEQEEEQEEQEQEAPVTSSDSITTAFETSIKIDILSNDTDINSDDLTINGVETPTNNGTVVINSDKTTVTYTPNDGFSGTDTFRYTVKDCQGGFTVGTVTVGVEGSN
jgi:hypothetical protein